MTLRIGFIGSGGIANAHAKALRKVMGDFDAEIVAACDVDEARAKKLLGGSGEGKNGEGGGGNTYMDHVKMLASEKLDAVWVCTPPHAHGEIEIAVAEHVPAVMIEKPIGNSVETSLEVQEAFEKAGTIAGAAYMNRYRKSSERAKELLSDPDDPPVVVLGWWIGGMPGVPWWRRKDQSGGQMNEQATHVVDLARWLVGDVAEVSAYGAKGFVTGVENYTVEDAVFMNLKFASGAVGNISTGCYVERGHDAGLGVSLTVATRKVKCAMGGWGMELKATGEKDWSETVPGQDDIFEIEDRTFLEAVTKEDASLVRSPYPDAVKSLAVALAANESMEKGAPVKPAC